jgi:hypothetical protein
MTDNFHARPAGFSLCGNLKLRRPLGGALRAIERDNGKRGRAERRPMKTSLFCRISVYT